MLVLATVAVDVMFLSIVFCGQTWDFIFLFQKKFMLDCLDRPL